MKNARKIFLILFLISLSTLFVACNISNNKSKQSYRVEYTADWGGHIEGVASQNVKEGEDASTVSAVADEGYVFFKWSDENTDPERTDKNITKDVVYSAYFQLDVTYYSVRYRAGEGGEISGVREQTVAQYGNASAVEAVAKPGYKFLGWSDGKTEAARRDTYMLADIDVEARFEFLFEGGTGSETDPLIIANKQQFLNMREWRGSHYKLQNDLSFVGENYQPVFDVAAPFDGVFDGGGHSITDVTITVPGECPSIFGAIGENGEVSNLNISAFNIDINNIYNIDTIYIGSVAGVSQGKIFDIVADVQISIARLQAKTMAIGGLIGLAYNSIDNCSVNSEIDLQVNNDDFGVAYLYVGGLFGDGHTKLVNNCLVSGTVSVRDTGSTDKSRILVGGLAAKIGIFDIALANIEKCRSDVAINAEFDGEIGGAVCYVYCSNDSVLNIEDCSSSGNISVPSNRTYIGGFITNFSSMNVSSIKDCFSSGRYFTSSGYVGGLIYRADNLQIDNCYSTAEIETTVAGMAAGFVFQLANSHVSNSYATGNVSGGMAAGFAQDIYSSAGERCIIENCHSSQNLFAQFNGSGFSLFIRYADIIGCYSTSDVYISNDDPNASRRMMIYGFASCEGSTVVNCSFLGRITGEGYITETIPPASKSTVAVAFGIIRTSTITAFHFYEDPMSRADTVVYKQDEASTVELIGQVTQQLP